MQANAACLKLLWHALQGLDDGISCLNGVKMSSPNSTRPATQLWLKGLLPSQDSVKDVALAFQQWIGTYGGFLAQQNA